MDAQSGPIETVITPPIRDLGDGFKVRRALPQAERRAVGPFVFFDQMGSATFAPGQGLDVRPHPHIGLATLTYLFAGEILHRDSLGTVQTIRPGEVNLMTAGRGIVHSERSPPARHTERPLFGIQAWLALPREHEETEPAFDHYPAGSLPMIEDRGRRICVVAGSLAGKRSPVKTFTDTLYLDAALEPGASLLLPAEAGAERALYVATGSAAIDGVSFEAGQFVVFRPGAAVEVKCATATRLIMVGGEPLDAHRHMFWNFVSSSRERIDVAKDDWKAGRFPPVPGDTEFIPLPEAPPAPVHYP